MTTLAFLDIESTGLYPWAGAEVWEVGLILRIPMPDEDGGGTEDVEYEWQLQVDLGKADPMALKIGRFYERACAGVAARPIEVCGRLAYKKVGSGSYGPTGYPIDEWARRFAELTAGAHIVGAVPAFDADFLSRLLRASGACPSWSYHLIDVEALAAGYLAGVRLDSAELGGGAAEDHADNLRVAAPPWNSSALSEAVGVKPDEFDKHTALGDARWARAIYDAVMGEQP